jgi:ADP-ribose pyrophosphatase YjhB (NUDIX family)
MATRSSGADGTNPRAWPVKLAESFGGVVVRTMPDGSHDVALIKTRNLKGAEVWALPKGGAEPGETPQAAALREVREETGLDADIVEPLDSITYWFSWPPEKVRYKKTVHLFLMRATGGDTAAHDDEVEEVRFFALPDAARVVTYRTDKQVLARLAELARTW